MNFTCVKFLMIIPILSSITATNDNKTEDGNTGCFTTIIIASDLHEIFCNVLSEVLVDEVLASIGQLTMFRLTLGDIQFENWTIQGDWYQGGNGRDVTHLRFVNCSFSLIASDAFCSKALRKLKRLSFHNIDSIKFISGWAEGLPLIYINIENAMVEDLQYDVLHVPSLKMLIMFSSFGNYNIMNIFESSGQTLSHLNITNAPSIRTISGMHLFRLNGIRHLVLNSCGIEIIAENTFLKTQLLTSLDLGGNHLKTLPATALDTLLHSRYLLSINLMNNEWECYCDLLTARDHLTTYDFAFPSFPKNCPFTEMTKPNGTYIHDEKLCLDSENVTITKYKSCEMEIGFDTIFIGYPKFIIKADISLSNLLIKSPTEQNNNYYYFTPNHGDFPKLTHKSEKCSDFTSVPCWIFKNQTQSLPLKMFHGQKPRTFYFVDSGARTGIWPYNSVSICKGCDEITKVWLRLSSILWASIISVIVGMICISIGMTLGFLLLRLCPKLLRGSKRVIFLQNNTADRKYSSTIFVMPSDWKCPGRQNERSNKIEQQRPNMDDTMSISSSYFSIRTDHDPVYEYLEFQPPLPPRPKETKNWIDD